MSVYYPNLESFMKRYDLTIGDIAKVIGKSYPPTHQKINRKSSKLGKASTFDIDEAYSIICFIKKTEKESLKSKYGDKWVDEWNKRWGHITDWFRYIFFDEVVTDVTKSV